MRPARELHSASVMPQLVRFAVAYLVLNGLLIVIFAVTGWAANAGITLGALIGAAVFAGHGFFKAHGRLPGSWETSKLVLGSLLICFVASALLAVVAGMVLTGSLSALVERIAAWSKQYSASVATFGILTIVAVYAVLLRLCYGPLLRAVVGLAANDPPPKW